MDKNSRIDSELLITVIRKHESIWNKDLKEYHKKATKEASWNQVCAELIHDWDSLSEQDKTLKQFLLKKRWNNIRDYYKKDLAMQLSGTIGQPSMKRRKYMFSNKLEFLRPHYGIYTEKTSDDDQDNQGDDTEENIKIYLDSDSEDSFTPRKKLKTTLSQEETTFSLPVTQNTSDASSSAHEPNEEKAKGTSETLDREDDCDLLFLRSLLPDMKALNRREKIDFKLGILQLYKKIISPQERDPFHNDCEDRKFSLE